MSHRQGQIYTYEASDDPWVIDSGRPQDTMCSDITITPEVTKSLGSWPSTAPNWPTTRSSMPTRSASRIGRSPFMSGNTGLDDAIPTVTRGPCSTEDSGTDYTPTGYPDDNNDVFEHLPISHLVYLA